jgi:hypothetical protein
VPIPKQVVEGGALNKRQRRTAWAAIALIGLMGIYPPWRGMEKTGRYSQVTEYGWIARPPVLPWFLAQIDNWENLQRPEIAKYLDPADWSWQIDVTRLLVQWATVALVGAGAICTLRQ